MPIRIHSTEKKAAAFIAGKEEIDGSRVTVNLRFDRALLGSGPQFEFPELAGRGLAALGNRNV
jgi:hypothetical protein